MQVKMAAVISLDGKIKGAEIPHKREWVSKEDKAYFKHLMDDYDLIVMGRKTYTSMALVPKSGKHYIVLTKNPKLYETTNTDGSLVFSKDNPRQIVTKYTKFGFKRLLVIGGSSLYAAFLEARLVDELDCTIEPIILGQGTDFVKSLKSSVGLRLSKQLQLNEQGTLLLKLHIST